MQPALDAPKMLRSRNDFLAGKTPLGEADAVDQIEIEHLRHEHFARRRVDLRQPGANVGEPPGMLHSRLLRRLPHDALGREILRGADDPMPVDVRSEARYADSV